ncbi:hypothetical protein F4604DRAFT_1684596 [Suillus subluteus]|nr:hypothetical protein F4604DRAFT_1684596 [Suillus subluteus]
MVRPQLYNSPEEKAKAARKYRQDYKIRITKSIDQKLFAVIGHSSREALEALCCALIECEESEVCNGLIDVLAVLDIIEDLEQEARKIGTAVLTRVREVRISLQDIIAWVRIDMDALEEAYEKGEIYYQYTDTRNTHVKIKRVTWMSRRPCLFCIVMPRWQPTRDQHAWLMPRLSKFQRLPFSKDKVFRVQLHKDWLEDWPERDALWPDLAGQALALTEHQQHELDSAEAALEQNGTDIEGMDILGLAESQTRSCQQDFTSLGPKRPHIYFMKTGRRRLSEADDLWNECASEAERCCGTGKAERCCGTGEAERRCGTGEEEQRCVALNLQEGGVRGNSTKDCEIVNTLAPDKRWAFLAGHKHILGVVVEGAPTAG